MITPRLIAFAGVMPWFGQAARWWARLYAENSVVSVRSATGQTFRWRRHHRYVNSYWLGHYETAVQEALARELQPGNTYYDIGAHAGFFTLLGAKIVGDRGRCVAVDPLPENYFSILEQIELNCLSACHVVNAALANFVGTNLFSSSTTGSSTAHLGGAVEGETESQVPVLTLDEIGKLFGGPNLIKLDVEGAETLVLKGAEHTLQVHRPVWIIELHGPECEREVRDCLVAAEYEFFDLAAQAISPSQKLPRHFLARPQERATP